MFIDKRRKVRVDDESTPTGIRIDLFCQYCESKLISRFKRTCQACGKEVIEDPGCEIEDRK